MVDKGKKVVKVSEAGQWPDMVTLPALIAGTVLTTAGFLMAFLYAAPVNGAALNAPGLVGDVIVTHQQL
ncbi:MAG: cytochrome C assembly protein, partial [Eggerthellaceae bacterium]|nr:cytochrome C assembly protein [Eggerthellaceae bacterium]